jgi:hypothetical protein
VQPRISNFEIITKDQRNIGILWVIEACELAGDGIITTDQRDFPKPSLSFRETKNIEINGLSVRSI